MKERIQNLSTVTEATYLKGTDLSEYNETGTKKTIA